MRAAVWSLMLADTVQVLRRGVSTPLGAVTATVTPGRFSQEERLTVSLHQGDISERLCIAVVYHGWKWYAPWAELTRIASIVELAGHRIAYFDSSVEYAILTMFADAIEPPGHLFVSYETDQETARALNRGVPPPVTRLGYQLFIRGFTWFKDWYHPEGWMEGGQKLQAEKALDAEHRQRHHETIMRDIETFLTTDTDNIDNIAAARHRARRVLGQLRQ